MPIHTENCMLSLGSCNQYLLFSPTLQNNNNNVCEATPYVEKPNLLLFSIGIFRLMNV